MASKKPPATPEAKPKAGRGGGRPNSGRKPKAITELRETLIPLADAQVGPGIASAAEYALDLFKSTMKDEARPLDLRLDCAREVLNRTIGKPRPAAEAPPDGGGKADSIHVYIPDNGRDGNGAG